MSEEEFDELINTIPKVENDNPISSMNNINVEDLRNAVERLKKIPTYQDLLKENQELNKKLEEHIKAETKMEDEYRELEKQLEAKKEQVSYLRRSVERKEEIIDDLEEEIIPYTNECVKKLENQQKEFVSWLEANIAECDKYLNNKDNYWDEDGREFALTRKAAFVEALSKCKEIVGGK